MAGMKVVPVGTAHDGSVNMDDLKKKVSDINLNKSGSNQLGKHTG